MVEKSKDSHSSEDVVDLDRRAWNLPGPRHAPVAPAREAWPVSEPNPPDDDPPERPAAA